MHKVQKNLLDLLILKLQFNSLFDLITISIIQIFLLNLIKLKLLFNSSFEKIVVIVGIGFGVFSSTWCRFVVLFLGNFFAYWCYMPFSYSLL